MNYTSLYYFGLWLWFYRLSLIIWVTNRYVPIIFKLWVHRLLWIVNREFIDYLVLRLWFTGLPLIMCLLYAVLWINFGWHHYGVMHVACFMQPFSFPVYAQFALSYGWIAVGAGKLPAAGALFLLIYIRRIYAVCA